MAIEGVYLTTTTESSQTKSTNIHKPPILLELLEDIKQDEIVSLSFPSIFGGMYDILVGITTIWKLLD